MTWRRSMWAIVLVASVAVAAALAFRPVSPLVGSVNQEVVACSAQSSVGWLLDPARPTIRATREAHDFCRTWASFYIAVAGVTLASGALATMMHLRTRRSLATDGHS